MNALDNADITTRIYNIKYIGCKIETTKGYKITRQLPLNLPIAL